MSDYYSTRQAASLLGIKPCRLQQAIWQNRINPPAKGPSGQYLWTIKDIDHASWALLKKSYTTQEVSTDGQ